VIQAVFFDHGNTLARPFGGSWFPGHRFGEIARAHGLGLAPDAPLETALARGYAFLHANHYAVASIDDEDGHFAEYYGVVLKELGLPAPPELLAQLSRAYVRELNFEPYDDTRASLDRLRAMRMPLAVITDSWPSVEAKYAQLGLRDYFSAFVISSRERALKPDPRIFAPALRALGVAPHEVLFIDDGVDLVQRAREQGFRGLVMDRARALPAQSGVITQLAELFGQLGE
jgi:putative hydrolase of the HAD superfamily